MPNINFDPYDRGLPTGDKLRQECRRLAPYFKGAAERDPDADEAEWFVYHVLRAIAAGKLKETP